MSMAISFLSGKGGSGKTTMVLGLADLFSKSKISTLLVDCDFVTNGATYFFEPIISSIANKEKNSILSFYDVLFSSQELKPSCIKVKPFWDMIPSIPEISVLQSNNNMSISYDDYCCKRLENFICWAKERYEIILFDCAAGYTELLKMLLPQIDIDLFVLEADSISASSLRNLHLKIGKYLGNAHLYQVFNKATPEEYDVYSKIVGTFFTNIGTLLFDWKIRQAFSRSQVPDFFNESIGYGLSLCEISLIMIHDALLKEKIKKNLAVIKLNKLKQERLKTERKMESIEKEVKTSYKRILIPLVYIFISFVAVLFMLFLVLSKKASELFAVNDMLCGLVLLNSLSLSSAFILLTSTHRNLISKRRDIRIKLSNIDSEIADAEFQTGSVVSVNNYMSH